MNENNNSTNENNDLMPLSPPLQLPELEFVNVIKKVWDRNSRILSASKRLYAAAVTAKVWLDINECEVPLSAIEELDQALAEYDSVRRR